MIERRGFVIGSLEPARLENEGIDERCLWLKTQLTSQHAT